MKHCNWLHALCFVIVLWAAGMRGEVMAAVLQAQFYVATNGDDSDPGTMSKPFATLLRARDAVRDLRAKGPAKGSITVMVRGGKYFLDTTVALSAEDSGNRESPTIYTAYPGEQPIVSGGQKVVNWKPYHSKIMVGELSRQKVTASEARLLTFNGEIQRRARWPNFDAAKNPTQGGWLRMEGSATPNSHIAFRVKPGTFPRSWAKPQEGEINVNAGLSDWAQCIVPMRSYDAESRVVTVTHEIWRGGLDNFTRYRSMPFRPEVGFVVENVLEELDEPGEWYLDSEAGTVYFWPPEELTEGSEVVLPRLDLLIDLQGVSHVTISGFAFTETTSGDNYHRFGLDGYGAMFPVQGWKYCGESVHLRNAAYCTIEKSRFHALGGNAVYLEGYNLKNDIRRNTFQSVGANGVVLIGTKDRHPMFNRVTDNHFDRSGAILYYTASVFSGLSNGNLIAHNNIHDVPHHGINLSTNGYGRNVVEYNDIRRTCRVLRDNGAINTWGDPRDIEADTGRITIVREAERAGHLFRYNFISDAPQGFYLDDWTSNCFLYGNIIARVGTGIRVHGGKNNIIENNVIVEANTGIIFKSFECLHGRPNAVTMMNFGVGNRYRHNIIYAQDKTNSLLLASWRPENEAGNTEKEIAESDYNVFFNRAGYRVQDAGRNIANLDQWRTLGYDTHSIIADPLFADPAADDYRLEPGSPAFEIGFQPIPTERIGIRDPTETDDVCPASPPGTDGPQSQ